MAVLLACSPALAGFVTVPGGDVINVDFEGALADRPEADRGLGPAIPGNHSGSDGVLSTGGTVWNDVFVFPSTVNNLLTEFGGPSQVDITLVRPLDTYSFLTDQNDLQDSGISGTSNFQLLQNADEANGAPDPTTILLSDLVSSAVYDLAVYISSRSAEGNRIQVANGGPTASMSQSTLASFLLPGTPGGDYLLFSGLTPVDLGGGVGELRILLQDLGEVPTFVAGLQLAVVPEPGVLGLVLAGGMVFWFRRRRR
jgi:hypothetical protein